MKLIGLTENTPILFNVVNPNIVACFMELIEICKIKEDPRRNLLIMSKSYALLFEIASALKDINPIITKESHPVVEQVINYIMEHYQEKISLNELASLTHVNKCYLTSLFKKSTGLTPIQYLIQYRISYACQLLKTNMTVNEICEQSGFQELTNFLIRFKQHTGSTPSQYRKVLSETADVTNV